MVNVYFTQEQLKELVWIVDMFNNSHELHMDKKEAKIVKEIINKINKKYRKYV